MSYHLKSKLGCKYCVFWGNLTGTEKFKQDSQRIHGKNKFNYDLVDFTDNKTSVKLKCLNCNTIFTMRPDCHLFNKNGCPNCNKSQIYTKEYYLKHNIPEHPVWLYLVSFENDSEKFIKIGFTIHENISYRFRGNHMNYVIKVIMKTNLMFFKAYNIEQTILKQYSSFRYYPINKFKRSYRSY